MKTFRASFSIALALFFASALAAASNQAFAGSCLSETPVPDDARVVQPAADVPPQYAQFSGVFSEGKWGREVCNTLVVEEVRADSSADVIYSHGRSSRWQITAKSYRTEAQINDGVLMFRIQGPNYTSNFSYELDGADELDGTFQAPGKSKLTSTLTRVSPTEAGVVVQHAME